MEKYLISGRQYTRTCIGDIPRTTNWDGKQDGRLKTDVDLRDLSIIVYFSVYTYA